MKAIPTNTVWRVVKGVSRIRNLGCKKVFFYCRYSLCSSSDQQRVNTLLNVSGICMLLYPTVRSGLCSALYSNVVLFLLCFSAFSLIYFMLCAALRSVSLSLSVSIRARKKRKIVAEK